MWPGFGLNEMVSKQNFFTVVLAVVAYWMDCFRHQVTSGNPEGMKDVRKQIELQSSELKLLGESDSISGDAAS